MNITYRKNLCYKWLGISLLRFNYPLLTARSWRSAVVSALDIEFNLSISVVLLENDLVMCQFLCCVGGL